MIKYTDRGYYASDMPLLDIRGIDEESGRLRPLFYPGYAEPYHPDVWDRADSLTLLQTGGMDNNRGNMYERRIAVVRIQADSKKLAASLETLLTSRFGASVIRETIGKPERVAIFRVDSAPIGNTTTELREHGQPIRSSNRVTIADTSSSLCPSGSAYRWKGGDPLTTRRESLPELTRDTADELIETAREIINKEIES